MHLWPNPSILKSRTPSIGTVRGSRPKGLKDEEWNLILADERLNRLITLNAVPKPSRADRTDKKDKR
jgi:hypothetical protein